MSQEKSKQAFRKGAMAAEQTSRVRLTPDLGTLKSGDGVHVLLADLIRMLKQLLDQALALGDPGRCQVAVMLLDALALPDVLLCDVNVETKPAKPGAAPKQPPPAPPPPLDAAAERQLNQDALAILTERSQGELSQLEDLVDRIGACDNPEHLRHRLFTVKKSWVKSQSGGDETHWGKLDGIREYLPTRQHAVFEGYIREAGTGSLRVAMLELSKDPDDAWKAAVQRSTSRSTDYLKLRYATQEVGDRLSQLHALKLPVRIEANVRMSLQDDAPADFCVSNAYAWGVSESDFQRAVQALADGLRSALPLDDQALG